MNNDILILGGTGKTGTRLAQLLRGAGEPVRTAARSGGDSRFDWDASATHDPALTGVDRVYLVPPALRTDAAPLVAGFLDRATAAGIRHVTMLSAHGVEQAPPEAMLRAIELELASRDSFTHSILRPSWFMQNLSEGFLEPGITERGVIALPAGDGAEAFVDAADIAAVAAATLRDPEVHAGAAFAVTGPEALNHAEVAQRIGAASGREVRYAEITREDWMRGATEAGVPDEYAGLLAGLLEVIRAGHGAQPTNVVSEVTGRPARTLGVFAVEAAAAGAWRPRGQELVA